VFLPLLGYERLTAMRSPTDCITEGSRLKVHHSSNRLNKMPPAVSDRGCPMRPRPAFCSRSTAFSEESGSAQPALCTVLRCAYVPLCVAVYSQADLPNGHFQDMILPVAVIATCPS